MERFLSAPGKLFLAGEYAVLWGGTARIAAVAPRAQAYVRRRDDAEVHLVLEEGRLLGRTTPLGVHWNTEVPEGFRFAARAIDELLRARAQDTLGFTVALAPSQKLPNGQKLGLGTSARATVLAAEAARYILDERADVLKVSLLAHALVQGLRGSGGDVAASYAGGLVRYRRFAVEEVLRAERPRAAALRDSPPVDLVRLALPTAHWLYASAGEGASTPKLIASAEHRLSAPERAAFVERSDELGQQLEESLLRGSFGTLVEAVEGLQALLASLAGVETGAISRILALSKSYGCVGKVSGAGGGDGCIVFCPDGARLTALLSALRGRGVLALELQPEPGLRGETPGDDRLRRWSTPER